METNLGSWMKCLAFHSVVYLRFIDNVCKEMSLKMKPEARALEALPLASDSWRLLGRIVTFVLGCNLWYTMHGHA